MTSESLQEWSTAPDPLDLIETTTTNDIIGKRNLTDISVVCELALRVGANHSLVAEISSGSLAAHNIVNETERTEIIDRRKVERQTSKLIKYAKV